jgi:hypothetical protein
MMMSPELQKFLTEFLFAIVTGIVAGVVAGWVIWRFQLNAQLALDDTPKIINMVQSLQEASTEITIARMMFEHGREHDKDFDADKEILEVQSKVGEASLLILKLASQAQFLRSKQYRQLRAYLVLRIQRSEAWFEEDTDQMIKRIDELLADINYFLHRASLMSKLKGVWEKLKKPLVAFRNRLTREQKELLVAGTRLDAYISVIAEPSPFVHIIPFRMYVGDDAPKYVEAFNKLLGAGYLQNTVGESYQLSRKGWKEAVRLTKGKNEPGVLI